MSQGERNLIFLFRDLDFAVGQPNGGRTQNVVSLNTKYKKLDDSASDRSTRNCVSCMSLKNTTYTLRGTCEESLLGNLTTIS